MGLDKEDYERMCGTTMTARHLDAVRQYANSIALSAQSQEGLTICDLLRQTYGDEKGRELFRQNRACSELGQYPYPVVAAVLDRFATRH